MDSAKPPTLRRLITRIVFTLVGLSLLYVLSGGPAWRLYIRSPESRPLIEKFYAPVIWIGTETPLQAPLLWYLNCWMDWPGDSDRRDRVIGTPL